MPTLRRMRLGFEPIILFVALGLAGVVAAARALLGWAMDAS
jgi:hypothetical protein